jgi:hypothetical protein
MTPFEIALAILAAISWLFTHELGHCIVAHALHVDFRTRFCWKGPYLEFADEVSLKQLDLVVLGGLLGILPMVVLLWFGVVPFAFAVSVLLAYCPIELWWNRKERADNLKREQGIH